MSRDASGLYTLPAGNPVVTGTTITTTWANATLTDIADTLSDSLSRSGLGGMTAPLRGIDGSLGSPSLAFTSEITLGLYRLSAGTIGVTGDLRMPTASSFGFGASGPRISSFLTDRMDFATAGATRMSILASGGVLIGNNTPGINGSLSVIAETAATFLLQSGVSGAQFQLQSLSNAASFGTLNNLPLVFHTNGAGSERMRLDASGSLLVGHTTNSNAGRITSEALAGFSPSGADNWKKTALATRGGFGGGIALVNTGGASDGYCLYLENIPSNFIIRYGANAGGASTNGVFLTSTATAWASASDERLKDTIEPITGALDKLAALRTVIGKYKDDPADMRRAFLFAQDVQAVLPEAVCKADAAGHLGLAYTDLIPLIIAAINEIRA